MSNKRLNFKRMYVTLGRKGGWGFLSFFALLLSLSALFASSANAGLQLEVGGGAGYDSNVVPDYSNSGSGLGDYHYSLEALIGWQTAKHKGRQKSMQFQASYWIKQRKWQAYSMFDSRIQSGLLRASHQGSVFNTDLSFIGAKADVDAKPYLTLYRLSPGVGFSPTPNWHVRTQLDAMQKNYQNNSQRDSKRLGARLQLYWFMHRVGLMLNATGQLYDNQAENNLYSYQAQIARFTVRKRNHWFGKKVSNRLRLKLENRIYDQRRDSRWRVEFTNDWQLSQRWHWRWTLQRGEHISDFALYDYDQSNIETSLHWRF